MTIETFKKILISIALILSAFSLVFGVMFCLVGGIGVVSKTIIWGIVRIVMTIPFLYISLFFYLFAKNGQKTL